MVLVRWVGDLVRDGVDWWGFGRGEVDDCLGFCLVYRSVVASDRFVDVCLFGSVVIFLVVGRAVGCGIVVRGGRVRRRRSTAFRFGCGGCV